MKEKKCTRIGARQKDATFIQKIARKNGQTEAQALHDIVGCYRKGKYLKLVLEAYKNMQADPEKWRKALAQSPDK